LRGFEQALVRLYAWYRSTQSMERNVHRDRHLVPVLDELMASTGDAQMAAVAAAHASALAQPVPAPLTAVIRLAFAFSTWELLQQEGLTDPQMAALMTKLARAARANPAHSPRRAR
jgi:hypothetical protein